jgi:hypothetical protein
MTVRGTVALGAVFALLAGYLLFTRPAPTPTMEREAALAPSLGAASAVEIEWGTETTRIARHHDKWTEPGVDDLLEALASLPVLGVIDPAPSDPSLYGFGPDALRLRVRSDAAELVALDVGALNPAATGVYVRRVGQPPVLLVGALLHWELEKLRRVVSTTTSP